MKAMIFAAGLGTRFKPWTDHHPKALALVNGKSLLQRNIAYLQQYGITDVLVNTHHFASQVTDAIIQNNGWGSKIVVSDESGEILETGGGLKKAAWFFDQSPFVVINADILTDLNLSAMIDHHKKSKPLATLAVTNRETSRYFLFDAENKLCGWRNTKTGEEKGPVTTYTVEQKNDIVQKAFSGIHIIEPELLTRIKQNGKFSIVDVYLDLCKTELMAGFDHSSSKLVDVGRTESVAKAEALFP